MTWVAIISTTVVMPTVWYLNFSKLSFISIIGVISNSVIVLCCLGITIYTIAFGCNSGDLNFTPPVCNSTFRFSDNFWPADGMVSFSLAIGIYILSLAGHAALPSIYHQMEKPEEFERAVDISFVIMFIMYVKANFFFKVLI